MQLGDGIAALSASAILSSPSATLRLWVSHIIE